MPNQAWQGGSVPNRSNHYAKSCIFNTTIQPWVIKEQHQEDMHFRLMRLIEKNPQVSQREIPNQLGVSLGGINHCLKALIAKGYVKVSNFSESRNKFGYVYLLTPSGLAAKAALAGQFLTRKLKEHEALKAEIESIQDADILTPMQPNDQNGKKGSR